MAENILEYISLSQFAKELGRNPRTLQTWAKTGKIKAKLLFGRYLVERKYAEEFKKRHVIDVEAG